MPDVSYMKMTLKESSKHCCSQALDQLQAGWLSLGYWADLAQLAQQLTARQQLMGGSGNLAAAGQTLLREKQSLYFFRYVCVCV
jgi:hypothetical protein